ncbi:MAG: restriction endonuclease subunit S [Nostoc sp.]|uniref:restriction endonuclease subunit S n=1 Tax=Nostoc sp. TaxID=1180 RepID=UPI002FFCA144
MSEIQLPPHWKVVKLGEYCEKPEYGYTASATEKDSGYKFLRITDIQDGTVQWNNVPYCEIDKTKIDKYILILGDIVVARIGATTGKSFLIDDCPEAVFASYLIRIRTKHELLPSFLNFYFETETYWQQIDANKGGKLKGGVNIPIIKNLLVPLPPLPEQKTIAHTLRTIQKAKETRQRELDLERERKAALMQYLFTNGTGNEPRKQTDIGKIPESWQVVKLGEICSISTGTTPSTNKPEYYIGNIPFIKTAQIVNNRIYESDTYISEQALLNYNLKIYPPKTVFMAMYGQGKTRGQVALLEIGAATTQNTAAIIPNYKIDSEFLWQYLMNQYEKLREAAHQGQISHLNLGLLKQYKIAFPSPEEQIYITDILKNCDRKISSLEKEITLIDELFHAMLEQLMTGKISTQPVTETYV